MGSDSPFRAITELGTLQSRHPLARYTRITLAVMGVVYLLGGGLLLVGAYFVIREQYQETGSLMASLWLPLFCAGVWLAPGLALARQMWWNGVWGLAVYEKGLAVHTRAGVTPIPWDSIVRFWERHAVRGGFHGYGLLTQEGRTFRLDYNFENFAQFCEAAVPRIQAAVARRRLGAPPG